MGDTLTINELFETNLSLSVIPNKGESQFESYQSIIAAIMFAWDQQTDDPSYMTPYEYLCWENNIKLSLSSRCNNCIFFKQPVKGSTHFKAKRDNKVYDPYEYYQAKDTQGFCQMFAFFLYTDNTSEFKKIDKSVKKINDAEFCKLSINTYECLQKTIKILEKNAGVRDRFIMYFDDLDKEEYGIKQGTTYKTFMKELKSFTLLSVMYYIYDNPLKGWGKKYFNDHLWNFIMNYKKSTKGRPRKRQKLN
jgi:hypothetical protein